MIFPVHVSEFSLSSLSPSQAPNLGVVVYQLKHCANYFMTVYESRKQHLRKLEGLAELSTEDLKQVINIHGLINTHFGKFSKISNTFFIPSSK